VKVREREINVVELAMSCDWNGGLSEEKGGVNGNGKKKL